jgi:hypothetical protein
MEVVCDLLLKEVWAETCVKCQSCDGEIRTTGSGTYGLILDRGGFGTKP